MIKYRSKCIFILVILSQALAFGKGAATSNLIRLDLALTVGAELTNFKKTEGSYEYSHTNTASGVGFLGRLGMRLSAFSFGVAGDLSGYQETGYKSRSGQSSVEYKFEDTQKLVGGYLSFDIGTSLNLEIMSEFYPSAQATVTTSDNLSQNPYKVNDVLKGSGWGIGFGRSLPKNGYGWVLIRKLTYNQVTLSGTESDLPSSTESARETWNLLVMGGKTFF